MKNRFLLIRAKFLQKILLIKKLYVPVSMKINQSKNCYEYMEQLRFYGHAYFFMIRLPMQVRRELPIDEKFPS